jgi:hypothetical protein
VVEAQAVRMSRELGAELWLVSSCTGDNVLDFFFRLTAMNFDRSVLRELERDRMEIKIGYDLISKYFQMHICVDLIMCYHFSTDKTSQNHRAKQNEEKFE